MDSGWLFILLFVGLFIAWIISESAKRKRNSERLEALLTKVPNFQPTVKREAGSHWVVIDEVHAKLLLSAVGADSYSIFDAASILSVELHEDGKTLVKSGRGKAAGKAVVNTMVMPGLNLITGGPKAKAYAVEQIKRLEVRIVVDGPKPTQDIRLLNRPVRKDSSTYRTLDGNARFIHGKITALMQRAAEDRRQALHEVIDKAIQPGGEKQAAAGTQGGGSIADELVKLSALRDSGILTDKEFHTQKMRLLGNS